MELTIDKNVEFVEQKMLDMCQMFVDISDIVQIARSCVLKQNLVYIVINKSKK